MTAPALAARIERLRGLAGADPRVEAVLLYGSWSTGEADEHSDLDAYLFVEDAAAFDGPAFVAGLAPTSLAYVNLFGILAVVFDDLMRGEFHVEQADTGIAEVGGWPVHFPDVDAAVLLDRTGRLTAAVTTRATPVAPEPVGTAQQLVDELTNWTLLLAHVRRRGEIARAHHLLHTNLGPFQLQLCRLLRDRTGHWLTPSRALEADLPAADVARHAATTCALDAAAVAVAAAESWRWTRELAAQARDRFGTAVPDGLHEQIADLLALPPA